MSTDSFDKAIQKLSVQKNNSENTKALVDNASQNLSQTNRVVVKDGGKIKIIPLLQIQYIEAADDYVKIHTAEGVFLKKKTMQFFEDSLPKQQFIRTHRSYLINAQLITRIDPHEKDSHLVLLSTGMRLPVSKSGYAKLKDVLGI